jgi:putative flippase GtrA
MTRDRLPVCGAAALVLAEADRARSCIMAGEGNRSPTRIVAIQHPSAVSELLAIFRRLTRRRHLTTTSISGQPPLSPFCSLPFKLSAGVVVVSHHPTIQQDRLLPHCRASGDGFPTATMSPIHQLLRILRRARLHRFVLVGILNTLVGYACILVLQAISHNPILSNLWGYLLSAGFSYLAHSHLTFTNAPSLRSAAAYGGVLLASYGINLVVLKLSLYWFSPVVSQGLGVLSFAIFSYLGQLFFVFPGNQRRPG